MKDPVVIVSMARTPMGGFQGVFAPATASQLGGAAIRAAVERAGIAPGDVQEVIFGNVLSAGQGQAPARQASLAGGLPLATGCTTVNKMCGSAMKATMLSNDLLIAGTNQVMVSGGMESMSNAPYLLPRVREGLRMGHSEVKDHMFLDGLEDAYEKGLLMGVFAEQCAEQYGFTREAQDNFAIASLERAKKAIDSGSFDAEVTPVTVKTRKGEVVIEHDEQPHKANIEKIPTLRAAFKKDGTVTAANSSSISDGGAALVLMRRSEAERRGLTPKATIMGHSTFAQEPSLFTTAPVGAMKGLFERLNLGAKDFDLYEVNEAFAVVTMAAMHDLDLPHDKVNVHGGACALGHPLGCSGARIIVTLLAALEQYDLKRGMASLCIGGGEATAFAIERP